MDRDKKLIELREKLARLNKTLKEQDEDYKRKEDELAKLNAIVKVSDVFQRAYLKIIFVHI